MLKMMGTSFKANIQQIESNSSSLSMIELRITEALRKERLSLKTAEEYQKQFSELETLMTNYTKLLGEDCIEQFESDRERKLFGVVTNMMQ